MKKILLLALVIVGSTQLKAQQLTVKPADPFFFKTPKNNGLDQFKLTDSTLFKSLQPLNKTGQLALLQDIKGTDKSTTLFYSRMPVVKTNSNVDGMPIAKLGDNANMHYTMLIKKVKVVDPLAVPQPPAPKVSW